MSATRATCVRKRELYTQPYARVYNRTHTRAPSSLPSRSVRHSPSPTTLPPSLTYTLAAVTPTPSSLLTLPVDSCCPALSATLTRAVSVAAHARVSRTTHTRIHSCTPTVRHSAFPLYRRPAGLRASERARARRHGGPTDRRERRIKKRVGATESTREERETARVRRAHPRKAGVPLKSFRNLSRARRRIY